QRAVQKGESLRPGCARVALALQPILDGELQGLVQQKNAERGYPQPPAASRGHNQQTEQHRLQYKQPAAVLDGQCDAFEPHSRCIAVRGVVDSISWHQTDSSRIPSLRKSRALLIGVKGEYTGD